MRPDDPAFRAFAETVTRAVLPLVPAAATLDRLAAATTRQGVAKGDHLLRSGDVATHLLHVHRGLLRTYFPDATTGEDRTGQFFDEGQSFTDASSFLGGAPATRSIDALEVGEVLCLPRAALLAAYAADHAMERFGRLMVEAALVGSQRRAANLLTLAPDDRYRWFVTTRPEMARRVPQYLIASYLGITPEALSRIRGRIARKPPAQSE